MFDPNFADDEYLPVWQRLLAATVLPLLVAALGGAAWLYFLMHPVGPDIPGSPGDWGSIFYNGAVLIPPLLTAPFVLVLVGTAWIVRWTSWQAALRGGLLRLLIATGCGATVVGLLWALG
jgi:hypothetical protein